MIKLKEILYEGGKMFAPHSERITTSEMDKMIEKLNLTLSDFFIKFQPVKSLKSKKTHGDIDILVWPKYADWKDKLEKRLGDQIQDKAKNGNVYSYLIYCPTINKKVHVDFILVSDAKKFMTTSQYYFLNDFSGVVGIFAQHLNFLYGSEGFFKRYKDRKNNWHKIFITDDLMKGLRILGYKNPESKIEKLETMEQIVDFLIESPMIDYEYFRPENMNTDQRKDVKGRNNISYMLDLIGKIKPKASIYDEDYFLKKLYPDDYEKLKKEIDRIEKEAYLQSKYNGKWLIDTFGLKPGPIIGYILRQITKKFGDNLDNTDEETIKKFVKKLI